MDANITATPQQRTFIDALVFERGNIALVARAGTGKTSTILLGVDAYMRANPRAEIVVCAFNRAIAHEVKEKLAERGYDWHQVRASTVHALGLGLLKFVFKPKVDDNKVRDLIAAQNAPVFAEFAAQIAQLVHLAKVSGVGFFNDAPIGDPTTWYTIADHYDVNGFDDTTDLDRCVEAAQFIYKASLALTNVIDFDDMILFPLIKNLRVKYQKDLIFVDEYQDTSRARQALVRKFLKPFGQGRMVVVGDDRQAIYGFAGAGVTALSDGVAELNAKVLPLTITWRCPRTVVAAAQAYVPDLEAAPNAIEGQVLNLDALPEDMTPGRDAILCRNTAPLIANAYSLIRRGIAAKVEGREIGVGLEKLAKRWKVTTISALLTRVDDYKAREVQKAIAKGQEAKAEAIVDKCDTLVEIAHACLAQGKQNVSDVVAFITDLFADGTKDAVILATYHRSKGREWKRVYLLEHASRCPSPMARQEWQRQQEANLAYVAITRAQETLAYVN